MALERFQYEPVSLNVNEVCLEKVKALWNGHSVHPSYDRTVSQFLEDCWERGWSPFSEACSFYVKNKLKSKILNDKKGLKTKMLRGYQGITLWWCRRGKCGVMCINVKCLSCCKVDALGYFNYWIWDALMLIRSLKELVQQSCNFA